MYDQEKSNIIKNIGEFIIDIIVTIKKLNEGFELLDKLELIGYHYKGSLGKSNRFFFWKETDGNNTHNLHIVEKV